MNLYSYIRLIPVDLMCTSFPCQNSAEPASLVRGSRLCWLSIYAGYAYTGRPVLVKRPAQYSVPEASAGNWRVTISWTRFMLLILFRPFTMSHGLSKSLWPAECQSIVIFLSLAALIRCDCKWWHPTFLDVCNRSFYIIIIMVSWSPLPNSTGFPRGSVLGSVLFTLYKSPLSSLIFSTGLSYHLNADGTELHNIIHYNSHR